MDANEDDLVAAIARLLSGAGPDVLTGIGDDAAVVEPGAGQLVLAADVLVEAVHFDRAISSARSIGYRAVVVNVSDVAAMAASQAGLVSLGVPEDVDVSWVMELFGECAPRPTSMPSPSSGATSAGARRSSSRWRSRERSLRGARSSDRARGRATDSSSPARSAPRREAWPWRGCRVHQRMRARRGRARSGCSVRSRVGEAQVLARAGATAMMDLSDGLSTDLPRLCAASGVGARIEESSVPISDALIEAEDALSIDPLRLALSGGDDYELLATLPADRVEEPDSS